MALSHQLFYRLWHQSVVLEVANLGLKAVAAGTIANLMSACLAGISSCFNLDLAKTARFTKKRAPLLRSLRKKGVRFLCLLVALFGLNHFSHYFLLRFRLTRKSMSQRLIRIYLEYH
ncbi:hypothetical protein O9929_11600 [Vibrio lentus]|nr:hypothetical protein [Vibrio lentus]